MVSSPREYDFIIVGGGTSGLVLAARLTEDPSTQVLVLEAGENHLNNPNVSIPALWRSLIGSDLDWKFATAPQVSLITQEQRPRAKLMALQSQLNGRVIGYPQGRVLGGSSALNAEAFIAPSETGINYWSDCGNPGWDWKTMSPYYEKCHTPIVPPAEACADLGLGYLSEKNDAKCGGPIKTSYTDILENPLGKVWADTFQNLEYGLTGDPFSGGTTGGFAASTTVDPATKERSYSASAYFLPAQNRPNLSLLTGSGVEQILLDNERGCAVANGVVVTKDGERQVFTPRKEVILAAGTLNSPKILELSGIGSTDLLQSLGIDIVIENPNVGENLQDHPMTGISFEAKDRVKTLDGLIRQDPKAIEAAMKAYQIDKSGPFSGASINAFAFMPVVQFQSSCGKIALHRLLETQSLSRTDSSQSTEEGFVGSVISSADKSSVVYFMVAAQANFGADASDTGNDSQREDTANYITICALLSYPLSRGSVHIRSANTTDKPTIDPKFLSHSMDLELFAYHLQTLETLSTTEPLKSLLKPQGLRIPDFAPTRPDLEAAKEYLGRTVTAGWHPVGTCAMRPREKGGVVNERLIVHGSKNLRVVDGSIMPLIPRGNTQSTVYAVAERAADLIKEDHKMI